MIYSQMEVFVPDRIEVPINSLCSLFGFANLNGDIRVTRTCFVFSLQALSTHHCWEETHRLGQEDKGNLRQHNIKIFRLGGISTSDADLC